MAADHDPNDLAHAPTAFVASATTSTSVGSGVAGPAPFPSLGAKLEVLGAIGQGGMGTVFRARHRGLDRFVAVKLLDRRLTERGGEFIERFEREARVAANLNHPNIVIIHDFDVSADGSPYIEMELLSGKVLREVLATAAPMPLGELVGLLRGVADALDKVHAAGIYHRDLKPDNLFLTSEGALKILDFGIIHLVSDPAKLTGTGDLIGTPLYMAPEQLAGKGVTGASDVYALGLIVFEMLTGRLPFGGASLSDIMRRVSEPSPRASDVCAGVSPATADVIQKALAVDPQDRFRTATQFIEALAEEAVDAPGAGAIDADSSHGNSVAIARTQAPARSPFRSAVAVLVALALLLSGGFLVARVAGSRAPAAALVRDHGPARLIVVPFETHPDREVDKQLWPLTDRVLVNALTEADVRRRDVARVDPLLVAGEMKKREMTPPLTVDQARELAIALKADAFLHGRVLRTGGLVRLEATLSSVRDEARETYSADGADAFSAARALISNLSSSHLIRLRPDASSEPIVTEPPSGVVDVARLDASLASFVPGAAASADDLAARWVSVLRDPWSEEPYTAFSKAAAASNDDVLRDYAAVLGHGLRPDLACEDGAKALADRYPRSMGALAPSLCSFRRMKAADAVARAEEAFADMRLRPIAALFLAKTYAQAHDRKALVRFHERRVHLFPDDADAWSLLAMMHVEDGRTVDGRACMRVAESLYDPARDGLRVAVNATRFAIRSEDMAAARSWVDKLGAAKPSGDSDEMFRALLRATVLRLRGRFREASAVLEQARERLAAHHGDPYTEVATTLFYAYFAAGDETHATIVADDYAKLFPAETSPDHWAAALLQLAVRAKWGRVPKREASKQAFSLAERFEKSMPESGKRYRDGILCLWQSYMGDDAAATELLLQAQPENTLIGGCRFAAARLKAKEGKLADARALFARSRADMLFRANWYMELYLPALAGEADAAMRSGDTEGARVLYERIVAQYADADVDLAQVSHARSTIARLGDHDQRRDQ